MKVNSAVTRPAVRVVRTQWGGDGVPTPEPPARRVAARPIPARRRKPPSPTPPLPQPGNGRALKSGVQANGKNLVSYQETKRDVEAALSEASWLLPSDAPLVELLIRELAVYKFASDALLGGTGVATSRKLNAHKMLTRKARVIGELCDKLAMSPVARYKLGLTAARTERERVRVVPVKSEERAQQVANILARSGALPPPIVDAEVVSEDPEAPEVTPPDLKVIPEDGAA
jgi:hypothetical protein